MHYTQEGLTPCDKKSGGRRRNTRSFTFEDFKHTASFITNYAEEHALDITGRVPGFSRDDIKLLPFSETKRKVYSVYVEATTTAGMYCFSKYNSNIEEI